MAISSRTKNDAVYKKLRQDIIKGRLFPGQRLVMAELAKGFGVSETPVREAIRRLESEGLVAFTPHSGAVVADIDEAALVEIYLIRTELEALAARLAAAHITERDLEQIERKNGDIRRAIDDGRLDLVGPLNKEFHLKIYRSAPYPRLYKMIADLWDAFERWPGVFTYVPERAASSVIEHREIIEALRQGDADRAVGLIKDQKSRTKEALQTYLAVKG